MRFSVVTPSFRQAEWLHLCARSVADQGGAVEHLVQDAMSGPDVPAAVAGIATVSLKTERDRGMYDAVDQGLKRARGDILSYLNCDEQYMPGTLALVDRFFSENPQIDVLFGDALLVNAGGHALSYRRTVLPTAPHVRAVHLNTPTCATFFRRSVFERGHCFGSRWKVVGDAVWIYRLLRARVPMGVLPAPLAAFTFTGENLGATQRSLREGNRFRFGYWPNRITPWLELTHRTRKWISGAYRQRTFEYAIYTRISPEARVVLKAKQIGYGWPSQDSAGL